MRWARPRRRAAAAASARAQRASQRGWMSVEVQFTGEEVSRSPGSKEEAKQNKRVLLLSSLKLKMKRLVEGLEKCSDLVIS